MKMGFLLLALKLFLGCTQRNTLAIAAISIQYRQESKSRWCVEQSIYPCMHVIKRCSFSNVKIKPFFFTESTVCVFYVRATTCDTTHRCIHYITYMSYFIHVYVFSASVRVGLNTDTMRPVQWEWDHSGAHQPKVSGLQKSILFTFRLLLTSKAHYQTCKNHKRTFHLSGPTIDSFINLLCIPLRSQCGD